MFSSDLIKAQYVQKHWSGDFFFPLAQTACDKMWKWAQSIVITPIKGILNVC